MHVNKFRKTWLLRFLSIIIVISAVAVAQENRERTPAEMLPPQFAGILLQDWRVEREQPDDIIRFMGLKDGDIVADVGCGNGFFTSRLAEQIQPHGVVFAVDVQQGMLDQLMEGKEDDISNIYPVLGQYEDPLLPPGKIDWILLVDAYHEFSNPEPMLARMKESLAPGGRIALVEYRGETGPTKSKFPMPSDHTMTVSQIKDEWLPAGFEIVTSVDFLPIQHFFIFKNADDKSRPAIRPLSIGKTQNVSTFDHRIYFSGQPDEDAIKQFADFGVKTVINLRGVQEMADLEFDEKKIVESAGMTYMHVPMGFNFPDASDLQNIMNTLERSGDSPVLLHCFNSNRVGAIWSLYAGQRENVSMDAAIAEGKNAGMRVPEFETAVREKLSNE